MVRAEIPNLQSRGEESPSVSGATRRRLWVFSGLLLLATFLIYLPALFNDFVNYDDPDYVTSNSHVQQGWKWTEVGWAFSTGQASNWHPVTWLSHMLDCQLFGLRPAGHHFISVLFHGVNSVLLFRLLWLLTAEFWASGFVAAIFALHPLHVESVAWVSERKDLLSGLFFLLALQQYLVYAGDAPQELRRRVRYLACLLLFLLGLMSKPMLVTLPLILLMLDYWPLGRFGNDGRLAGTVGSTKGPSGRQEPRGRSDSGARLVLEKIPFVLLSLASCLVTFMVQRQGGAVSSLTTLSLWDRIANALVSYVRYLGKLFWPARLAVLYPHPRHWPLWLTVSSLALLLTVFIVVVAWRRRAPWLWLGWLWFFLMLLPVIGLVQVGIQSMADRYMYLPMIGLLVALVWGLLRWKPDTKWRLPLLQSGAVFGVLACSLLTFRQVQFWRDSESLFRRAAQVTSNNYLAYNNLGYYLSGHEKLDEAIASYRKSLEINPVYDDALNNLGYALAAQKKFAEAMPYYEAALKIRPRHVEVHNNLGNALAELGQLDEAITHYRSALADNPRHADAHNNLGIALAMQGKYDEAIAEFADALRCRPGYASAHSNLGNAYAVQRKFPEAIREYELCLALKADDSQAHNNLANALTESGRLDEAVVHYREALRLAPVNPETHFNLGVLLARQGNGTEAIQHLEEALKQKPDYTAARTQLETLRSTPP